MNAVLSTKHHFPKLRDHRTPKVEYHRFSFSYKTLSITRLAIIEYHYSTDIMPIVIQTRVVITNAAVVQCVLKSQHNAKMVTQYIINILH